MILPCQESKLSLFILAIQHDQTYYVLKFHSYRWGVPFFHLHRFEIAIFFMIFMNMVIMAFEHYGQRQIVVHILAGFNSFFTTIYALGTIILIF